MRSALGTPCRRAVLIDPVPQHSDATTFLAGRAEAVHVALTAACGGCRDVDTRLAQAASALADPVPGRSVPLRATDVGAAAIAVAYAPADRRSDLLAAVLSPRVGAAVVGSLADSVWQRYGTEDVSPAYLAYLREVCAAYPGWSAAAVGTGVITGTLQALHAPCAEGLVPFEATGDGPAGPLCVVSHAGDAVVPVGSARTWRGRPNTTVHLVPAGPHGDPAAAATCDMKDP